MTRASWRLDASAPTTQAVGTPSGTGAEPAQSVPTVFASLHYLRAALRRRRRTWLGLGLAGLIAGTGYAVAVPASPVASVVLKLGHAEGQDPSSAMQTDLNLLRTNVVTDRAADKLGVDPTELGADVSGMILTPDLLRVRVTGPTAHAAVDRAAVVADVFLARRAETLRLESDSWISSYQNQIDGLKTDAAGFQQHYNALSKGNASDQEQATSYLQQRDSDLQQVSQLQGKIDDTRQQIAAVIDASEAVDPAAIVPVSTPKRLVLTGATGLIGGGFVGIGLVLLQALTTTRLRRREEVALALAAPVLYAAGRTSRLRGSTRGSGVPALARGVGDLLGGPGRTRLLLLSLADDRRAEQLLDRVAVTAAQALAATGSRVLVVDLTRRGRLTAGAGVHVVRPSGLLARGPLGAGPAGRSGPATEVPAGWDEADAVLVVGQLGLDTGVDDLASWAERAVLLVRAGRSSAERLRSSAELLQVTGIELVGALLDGTDPTDESMGRPEILVPGARHSGPAPRTEPDGEPEPLAPQAEGAAARERAAAEAT